MRNPFPGGSLEARDFEDEVGERKFEEEVQREIDEAADALRAHEDAARRQAAPIPQPCHQCGHPFAGCICPLCKEERPAYAALKRRAA